MDFAHSPKALELESTLKDFMHELVFPAEAVFRQQTVDQGDRWGPPPVVAELKTAARGRGLWNLFLPDPRWGAGLANLDYAPLAEVTGWSPFIAPEALNCSPPDTGNMELLTLFGNADQQDRWLRPLLAGETRSCFAMTEPDVASSDANNIRLRVEVTGDELVLNGRKWWSSGAMRPDCRVSLVMGVTDPDAARGRRHSIVLVPLDTTGLTVLRSTTVLGYDDRAEGGHGELVFENVRVPRENLLGERGAGFAAAQARLGPGRIHHCMRLLGMAERALAMMCARVKERTAFGGPLAGQGVVQEWIAESRVRIDAARLLVLRTAWLMDTAGTRSARFDISAIKVLVPKTTAYVVDRAMQSFGGAGLSQDTLLPSLYAQARLLQVADGPDEVHQRSVARAELGRAPALPAT